MDKSVPARLVLSLVTAVFLGAYWAAARGSLEALVVAPRDLDIGTRWVTKSFSHVVTVRNPTSRAARIADIHLPCECVSITPTTVDIGPGSSAVLRLTWDLSAAPVNRANSQFRPEIHVLVQWPHRNSLQDTIQSWPITGRVQSAWQRFEGVLDLGDISSRVSTQRSVRLDCRPAGEDLTFVAADNLPPYLSAVARVTDNNVIDLNVRATYAATHEGYFEHDVWLTGLTRNGARVTGYPVKVNGYIRPPIRPFPPTVDFGACPVGMVARACLALESDGTMPFRVSSVEIQGDNLQAHALAPERLAWVYELRQVVHPGRHVASVAFLVESAGLSRVVHVPVKYVGVSCQAREGQSHDRE